MHAVSSIKSHHSKSQRVLKSVDEQHNESQFKCKIFLDTVLLLKTHNNGIYNESYLRHLSRFKYDNVVNGILKTGSL